MGTALSELGVETDISFTPADMCIRQENPALT